jgi:hypothetical protein
VAIGNITGNVKGSGKSGGYKSHNKEASEIHFVQILRVEKEIRYTQVFAETAGDHGKENNPAQHQHMIPFYVVEQELNRKRVEDLRTYKIKLAQHRQI